MTAAWAAEAKSVSARKERSAKLVGRQEGVVVFIGMGGCNAECGVRNAEWGTGGGLVNAERGMRNAEWEKGEEEAAEGEEEPVRREENFIG